MRRVIGKVDVLGVPITIIETNVDKELKVDGKPALGWYCSNNRLIVIDSRLPNHAKLAIRNHELGHAVVERMGLKLSDEKEEYLVDKVLPAYIEVLVKSQHIKFERKAK